jgi:D-amino-acid oxidase
VIARHRVAVAGAGVSGLTCAHELAPEFDVTVISSLPTTETTSAVATAIWHVYLVDPNDDQVLRRAATTFDRLMKLAATCPEAGVTLIRGIELFRSGVAERPSWAGIPRHFRMLEAADYCTFPGVEWGYEIETPVAQMSKYLPWLLAELQDRHVSFVRQSLSSLTDINREFDVIVNCTGLGSRALTGDPDLEGVRGQYILVKTPDDLPDFYVGDDQHPDGMSYSIPRPDGVCIGGTEEHGAEEAIFDIDIDLLLKRVSETTPWVGALRREDILNTFVGIRPLRHSGVRLERELLADGRYAVHNYGHGGSGFSLSWGCADEVVDYVKQLVVAIPR